MNRDLIFFVGGDNILYATHLDGVEDAFKVEATKDIISLLVDELREAKVRQKEIKEQIGRLISKEEQEQKLIKALKKIVYQVEE